jgi:hypothetical protein
MLTNHQIEDLAKRMKVPLEYVGFKSDLPNKLKTNRSYIINLDDEIDKATGIRSGGTHWTCFQIMEYPNGKKEGIYMDSYGAGPPEIVKKRVMDNFKLCLPHNKKDIQSLLNEACGWYCLAFLHFINVFPKRTQNLYWDTEAFLSLFEDLNESIDFKKNEYILKMFFQSSNPLERKPIEVISNPNNITGGCTDKISEEGAEYAGMETIDVDVKYI